MKQRSKTKYAGADWLESSAGQELSPFGRKVADILGQAWYGIYHISDEVLHKRCDWKSDRWIEVVIHGVLSSWDSDKITLLVALCHSQGVRFEVKGAAFNYLKLCFSQGHLGMGEMPSLPEHLEALQPLVDAIAQSSQEPIASTTQIAS